MTFNLNELNESQRAPVLDTEGALLVTAGAGSGKTRLLTHRIAYLIQELGVQPYRILAITFTNKAANEMKERVERMLGAAGSGVWVSTFHSMCVTMLRRFADQIGYAKSFSIYGETEKERLIKRILKDNGETEYDKDFCKNIIWAISDAKSKGLNSEQYYLEFGYQNHAEAVRDTYSAYEAELKKSNAFDFDDLLIKTLELLADSKEAREYYQEKFRYIHVDEFQDTNKVQYELIKILAQKHKNVMAVGDEDQSIYGWRGADITNIRAFIQDFNCKLYKLEQNYRSTKKILSLANQVIAYNEGRIEKTLWTDNAEGETPNFFVADSEQAEADFVTGQIKRLVDYEGYAYSDFAVLMRLNALTRSFEERFMQYGIPYRVTGGFKFYDRKEIKDILAYLRLCANHTDNEALLRIINFPKRGIGDAAVAQLMNYCALTNVLPYDVIKSITQNTDLPKALCKKMESFAAVLNCLEKAELELNVADLVKYLVRLLDLKTVFEEDTEENENRKLNIKELINSIEQYCKMNPDAGVFEYLQNVSLYSDSDNIDVNSGCVQIATVHSAKGLEFPCVFIVGLEDEIFPTSRSLDSQHELEEERRLIYVAVTRAEKRLFLSYASSRFLYGNRKWTVPSRFLKEMGFSMPKPQIINEYFGGQRGRENEQKYTKTTTMPVVVSKNPTKNENLDISQYRIGTRVRHKKFGIGVIASVTGTPDNCFALIEFETVGRMNLSLNYAPLEAVGES